MGMLQVKNLSDELHRALADRARSQGISMSEYVTRLLRRDLSRPSIAEWVADQRADPTPPRRIDVTWALDDRRVGYDTDDREAPAPGGVSAAHP